LATVTYSNRAHLLRELLSVEVDLKEDPEAARAEAVDFGLDEGLLQLALLVCLGYLKEIRYNVKACLGVFIPLAYLFHLKSNAQCSFFTIYMYIV
jgi:hypothetical protein